MKLGGNRMITRLVCVAALVAACVAPVAGAGSPSVTLRDAVGVPVLPGADACGIAPTGDGFAAGEWTDLELRVDAGQVRSSFRMIADANGHWQAAPSYPTLELLTLTWQGEHGSFGSILFRNVCLAPEPTRSPIPNRPRTFRTRRARRSSRPRNCKSGNSGASARSRRA